MNGPASFATFTAAGLLLVLFLRSGWVPILLAAPAVFALLLSLYRTAWLSLAAGLLFLLLPAATRKRAAAAILLGLAGLIVVAGVVLPLSEIGERLGTFGAVGEDGSAQERLAQFVFLWNQWDSGLFGVGFTVADVGSAGALAIDGMITTCWQYMGIVVGLLCLSGLVWASGNAIAAGLRGRSRETIMIGALGVGALVQLPLANISSGELGFLFWTFAALASFEPLRPRSSPIL